MARLNTSRDQASPTGLTSKSVTNFEPRVTRSQSVELGATDTGLPKRRGGPQNIRGVSVENVGSEKGRSLRSRRQKNTPPPTSITAELSMVAEDPEPEIPENQSGQSLEEEEEEGEEDENVDNDQREASPGAVSQISGITGMTADTDRDLAALDILMMVENLPDLYTETHQILNLLAPENPNLEIVQAIVKELRIPGSIRGKRLANKEKRFVLAAGNYSTEVGRTELHFLNKAIILRKLFGVQDPMYGNFRPDAIIYAANLAFLMKRMLVIYEDGDDALRDLQLLENGFSNAFVSGFDKQVKFGTSDLLEKTFELGLDLRTQITIAQFKHWRESPGFDSEKLLQAIFYEMDSEDGDQYPRVKGITGVPIQAMPLELQAPEILERVEAIRGTFHNLGDIADRDQLDFEELEATFPWSKFVTRVVQWARLRFEELEKSIARQGGPEKITNSLSEVIKDNQSQLYGSIDLPFMPQAAKKENVSLLPAADIESATTPKSLYTKGNMAFLKRLKQPRKGTLPEQALSSGTGKDPGPQTPPNQRRMPAERATEPAKITETMRKRPFENADDFYEPQLDDQSERGTEEYENYWESNTQDKNKENRPTDQQIDQTKAKRRRFIDRQPDAHKIPFESPEPTTHEHQQAEERSESEHSEESVFVTDQRTPPPSKRPAFRAQTQPSPELPPPRNSSSQEEIRPKDLKNKHVTSREPPVLPTQDDPDEEDAPAPTMESVNVVARQETVRAKMRQLGSGSHQQTRTPWSERDTELLRDRIAEHGCAWSAIVERGGFEVERGQVALRDKARNMKISYLKAGIVGDQLPENFEFVYLDKKGLAAVRLVLGNVDFNGLEIE